MATGSPARPSGARADVLAWPLFALLAAALALLAFACNADETARQASQGDRTTLTLAVIDDPQRRAALYAIEQGIVTSELVDLAVTYLPASSIEEAAPTKLYDAVEAAPLIVPHGIEGGIDYVVLSAGLRDLDGALLFARAGGGIDDPSDLRRRRLGVSSLSDPSTLAARALLRQRFGLVASREGGDIQLVEQPAESLPTLLNRGDIDAALLLNQGAFRLSADGSFRIVSHIARELAEEAGVQTASTVLVTQADTAAQKSQALQELNRLLGSSVAYLEGNQAAVLDAVAQEQGVDAQYLRWWWARHDLAFGDLSAGRQEEILALWQAAQAVGDIARYPDLATVLFDPEAPVSTPNQ